MTESTFDREDDVDADSKLANSRATGGDAEDGGDSAATTGTGQSEEFVGRAGGQDIGYEEESGAEVRGQAERDR